MTLDETVQDCLRGLERRPQSRWRVRLTLWARCAASSGTQTS